MSYLEKYVFDHPVYNRDERDKYWLLSLILRYTYSTANNIQGALYPFLAFP